MVAPPGHPGRDDGPDADAGGAAGGGRGGDRRAPAEGDHGTLQPNGSYYAGHGPHQHPEAHGCGAQRARTAPGVARPHAEPHGGDGAGAPQPPEPEHGPLGPPGHPPEPAGAASVQAAAHTHVHVPDARPHGRREVESRQRGRGAGSGNAVGGDGRMTPSERRLCSPQMSTPHLNPMHTHFASPQLPHLTEELRSLRSRQAATPDARGAGSGPDDHMDPAANSSISSMPEALFNDNVQYLSMTHPIPQGGVVPPVIHGLGISKEGIPMHTQQAAAAAAAPRDVVSMVTPGGEGVDKEGPKRRKVDPAAPPAPAWAGAPRPAGAGTMPVGPFDVRAGAVPPASAPLGAAVFGAGPAVTGVGLMGPGGAGLGGARLVGAGPIGAGPVEVNPGAAAATWGGPQAAAPQGIPAFLASEDGAHAQLTWGLPQDTCRLGMGMALWRTTRTEIHGPIRRLTPLRRLLFPHLSHLPKPKQQQSERPPPF
mmetsp:Transcript_16529/g.50651  ORF Transcript_16529/g.50651 Transcript_16529/m.50651 type:complete len:481 (-) Transcript_16529:44-1486(-)